MAKIFNETNTELSYTILIDKKQQQLTAAVLPSRFSNDKSNCKHIIQLSNEKNTQQ